MIKLVFETPTVMKIKCDSSLIPEIERILSYKNTSAQFQYDKLKKSRWMAQKFGVEYYNKILQNSKAEVDRCLLFKSPDGYWTYTGAVGIFEENYPGQVVVENNLKYPEAKILPWHFPMKNQLRPYQREAVDALLAAKHGAVSHATGSGKSTVLTQVIKELGLKTLVMAPSASIAEQLYEQLKINFGKKRVGMFDAKKKESDKQIVVAVAQSLVRVTEGTPHWSPLCETQVFIADESHTTPAETFQKVCLGVVANAPYRFFFSATQIRGDGQGILLQGIIGAVVHEYTVGEAIKDGYLVPMNFRMVKAHKKVNHSPEDPNENTRLHLFYNPLIHEKVIQLANNAVSVLNRKVLILIEEIEQFWHVASKLNHEYCFAHGGNLNEKQKSMVPKEWHTPDNNKLVEEYNSGKYPIMIGTSAVSIGTDIRAADFIIYWQGGKSEVQVKQAVGRGTRLFPGKKNCVVVDFDVQDVHVVHRHAEHRKKMYKEIGTFEYVEF